MALEEGLVDGVETLLLTGSSHAGSQHEVIGLDTLDGVGLSQGKLVLEGTGLVGAEDLDTSEGLNGRELLDDSLLLGEVGGTDSHGGGDDSRKTDGDTDDGDGQGELKDMNDSIGAVDGCDPDDQKGEDDEDEQDCTDTVEDLSEMTGSSGSSVDESGGATDEGAVSGGGDDHEGLTTLMAEGA